MVDMVGTLAERKPRLVNKFLESQENLTKQLLLTIESGDEKQLMKIIRQGEANLEQIGVVSKSAQEIIRKIERKKGAAKISGAGGKTASSGILLCYHKERQVIEKIAKAYGLPHFSVALGVEGVKKETIQQ